MIDIILASTSPRRKELLRQIGLQQFQILSPGVDEDVGPELSPAQMVEELSCRKAMAAQEHSSNVSGNALIIAADTSVFLAGHALGKPRDAQDAFQILQALSGQEHQVYTGFTILRGDGSKIVTEHEKTDVLFRTLSDQEIHDYISTGEPMDKAGAYGIQGVGALLISGIRGDYFNVMGLPVFRLGRALKQFGIDVLALACGRLTEVPERL